MSPQTRSHTDRHSLDYRLNSASAIYRYVLVSQTMVVVDRQRHTEPQILSASRQIRKEAQGIFLKENEFVVHIHNLRMDVPGPHWSQQLMAEDRKLRFFGKKRWQNLLEWLERYHDCEAFGLGWPPTESWLRVVAQAFRITDKLVDTPWPVVRERNCSTFVRRWRRRTGGGAGPRQHQRKARQDGPQAKHQDHYQMSSLWQGQDV